MKSDSEQDDGGLTHYADAEAMLSFGEQLRDIQGTDRVVVAAYRTDDPVPPGPEVKREHYWVGHVDGQYYGVRRSNGVGKAGKLTFEDACAFLEMPDPPFWDYEHVLSRVVAVENTPIPYNIAGKRSVECPECDAFGRTHVWKLDGYVPDECPVCGFGGEFHVTE